MSSVHLRLLIFLLAILIPACASSSPAFLMVYSAYKLKKSGGSEGKASCLQCERPGFHPFMGNRWGNNGNSEKLFFLAPKSLQMVTAAMKLKDAYSLEEKL